MQRPSPVLQIYIKEKVEKAIAAGHDLCIIFGSLTKNLSELGLSQRGSNMVNKERVSLLMLMLLISVNLHCFDEFTVVLSNPDSISYSIENGLIHISWNDNSENEDGFIIMSRFSGQQEWQQLGKTAQNISEYTDMRCRSNVKYLYKVKSFRIYKESEYSDELIVDAENLFSEIEVSSFRKNSISLGFPYLGIRFCFTELYDAELVLDYFNNLGFVSLRQYVKTYRTPKYKFYLGAETGIIFYSDHEFMNARLDGTGFLFMPYVGCEYFLSKRISLSCVFGPLYTSFNHEYVGNGFCAPKWTFDICINYFPGQLPVIME